MKKKARNLEQLTIRVSSKQDEHSPEVRDSDLVSRGVPGGAKTTMSCEEVGSTFGMSLARSEYGYHCSSSSRSRPVLVTH